MKKIALALALILAGSSIAVGLVSTDANAGARKMRPDETVQSRIQSSQGGRSRARVGCATGTAW